MAGTQSSTRTTLKVCRSGERSRLAAEALAAAYESLTPILRRAWPSSQSMRRCPPTEPSQRLAGGQKA
jgi:hypothetical protein